MGNFIRATFNQKKDDFTLSLDILPAAIVVTPNDVGVWIGGDFENKRGTALSRLIECRDVLIERDLVQDQLFYFTGNEGTGGKGSVTLDSGGAYVNPTESQMGIVVGGDFGGATGAFETSSGVFKSVINRLMERLNEALANK